MFYFVIQRHNTYATQNKRVTEGIKINTASHVPQSPKQGHPSASTASQLHGDNHYYWDLRTDFHCAQCLVIGTPWKGGASKTHFLLNWDIHHQENPNESTNNNFSTVEYIQLLVKWLPELVVFKTPLCRSQEFEILLQLGVNNEKNYFQPVGDSVAFNTTLLHVLRAVQVMWQQRKGSFYGDRGSMEEEIVNNFLAFDSLENPSSALQCQLLTYNLTPIPRTVDKWMWVSNTMPFSFASQNDCFRPLISPQINLSIYS